MASTRVLNSRDGATKIADPNNFPGLSRPGGGTAGTENNVIRIYQLALCSAITSAALKSGSAR